MWGVLVSRKGWLSILSVRLGDGNCFMLIMELQKINFQLYLMGNYCSENETCQADSKSLKRKRLSTNSTSSNDGADGDHNPEEMVLNSFEIVEILNLNDRVSKRPDCPEIGHVQVISELGKGAQAQVYKVNVETRDSPQRYSMGGQKSTIAIKRIHIESQLKNSHSLKLASSLLIQNDCPFLVKGMFICQSDKFIYEGMKLAEGGDLSSFLERTTGKGDAFRKLGEVGIRMVLAGVVLGIEYLHGKGLIYCDLKTDNVLIGKDGYPLLADFELAKQEKSIPVEQFEGTPTCAGPELYLEQAFDRSIDLWALGVLAYTLAYNEAPYSAEEIINRPADFTQDCQTRECKYKLNRKKISPELSDLINQLLRVRGSERVGYTSLKQIKDHQFFTLFNWQAYSTKQLANPLLDIVGKFSGSKRKGLTASEEY